jgi:hypothetical protein
MTPVTFAADVTMSNDVLGCGDLRIEGTIEAVSVIYAHSNVIVYQSEEIYGVLVVEQSAIVVGILSASNAA